MKRIIIYTIIITLISVAVKGQRNSNYADFQFRTLANFTNVRFDSAVDFDGAEFDSTANFVGAKFDSTAYFRTQFHNIANFTKTTFYSGANFDMARFDSAAYFPWIRFHNIASFYRTDFHSEANFDGAEFDSAAFFNDAFLPQTLHFQDVKIKGKDIDFIAARVDSIPDKRCHIYLSGTDIGKINLRYEMFKLAFENSISFDLKSNVYEKLLKRTEQLGYINSFKLLDKEYKEVTYLEGYKESKWFRNWLDKNWWGYGYNKEFIIRNTIFLFLFFSFINSLIFKQLSSKLYAMPKLLEIVNKIERRNKIIKFLQVYLVAVFYTGQIFFGLNISLKNLKYSENLKGWKILNLIYFFTVYLIGTVCLGYLANYVLSS